MEQVVLIGGLAVLVIEYVLGKTTWVKANSIVEVALNGIVTIFKALKPAK